MSNSNAQFRFEPALAGDGRALSQWELAARTTWGQYISQAEERAILAAVDAVGAPGQLLDNGCGEGRWTKLVGERGWSAICTDVDPVALEKCRVRNPRASCILITPEDRKLPVADGSVGLLLCIEVPGLLESEWFLREVQRVLAPAGRMVGIFHNRCSLRGWFRARADAAQGRASFYRMGFRHWERQIRRDYGLNVAVAEGLCWFPFRRTSNSRWVPWCTRLEQRIGLRGWVSSSPWVLFTARRLVAGLPA